MSEKNIPTRDPPKPWSWGWLHDRLTWPVIAAATFGLIAFGVPRLPDTLEGCDTQVRAMVQAGEGAFQRGEIEKADDIGQQALTLAPNCRCGHLLEGKINYWRMLVALKAGQAAAAQADKLACLAHVVRAAGLGGSDPEMEALRKSCSSTGADDN